MHLLIIGLHIVEKNVGIGDNLIKRLYWGKARGVDGGMNAVLF